MNSLSYWLKKELNYMFFRQYRYRRTERRHLMPYYSATAPGSTCSERMVVCMADGKYRHGGLADRFRSFVSIYSYCREHGVRFAINFTAPFKLEDYLIPNTYDWRLKPGELTMNSTEAHPVFMDLINAIDEREIQWQRNVTAQALAIPYKQVHVYTSFYFAQERFGSLFKQLFRPSPTLHQALLPHRTALGGKYISVSARFMELLGDFHEPKPERVLHAAEADSLILSCVEQVKELRNAHPQMRILVTADSERFLAACRAQVPEAYVVPGEIAHVDTTQSADHMKTFLDFYLISEAEHAYQLYTPPMYKGNFSLRAAQAGEIPHTLISF